MQLSNTKTSDNITLSTLFQNLIRKPPNGKFIPFLHWMHFLAIGPVNLQHANKGLHKYGTFPDLNEGEQWLSFLIPRGTVVVFLFFNSGFIISLPFAQVLSP